jgi:hypothetical protein
MISVTATPREEADLFRLLAAKEAELRSKNKGTLHRARANRKARTVSWKHSSYPGSITFQGCVGGMIAVVVKSRNAQEEWQLLNSFVGFLDRHFRDAIGCITISYGATATRLKKAAPKKISRR